MRTRFKAFLFSSLIFAFLFFQYSPLSFGIDRDEVAELEEFLIDFSKKVEGHRLSTGALPTDLNADKLFSLLEGYYPDREIIKKVKKYPVKVLHEDESYVLILCDQDSEYILYKDLGKTITVVDFPYWREEKRVPCE